MKARARKTDPDTSHAAAASINGRALSEITEKILSLLKASPRGLTEKEISIAIRGQRVCISPRFAPLKRVGLIYDTGVRRLNPGSRKLAIVYKSTWK